MDANQILELSDAAEQEAYEQDMDWHEWHLEHSMGYVTLGGEG